MSRRNQSSRRRSYGRRQHEVRERRVDDRTASAFAGDADREFDTEWTAAELADDRASYQSFQGLSQ